MPSSDTDIKKKGLLGRWQHDKKQRRSLSKIWCPSNETQQCKEKKREGSVSAGPRQDLKRNEAQGMNKAQGREMKQRRRGMGSAFSLGADFLQGRSCPTCRHTLPAGSLRGLHRKTQSATEQQML